MRTVATLTDTGPHDIPLCLLPRPDHSRTSDSQNRIDSSHAHILLPHRNRVPDLVGVASGEHTQNLGQQHRGPLLQAAQGKLLQTATRGWSAIDRQSGANCNFWVILRALHFSYSIDCARRALALCTSTLSLGPARGKAVLFFPTCEVITRSLGSRDPSNPSKSSAPTALW